MFFGFAVDITDAIFLQLTEQTWEYLYTLSRDLRLFGILLIAFKVCSYKNLHWKTFIFFMIIFQAIVIVINSTYLHKELNNITLLILNIFYITWLIKLRCMKKFIDKIPEPGQAYYILRPISSVLGLMQSVFIPWHPARYESRLIVNGVYVWSIHRRTFLKKHIKYTNIKELKGVRRPIKKPLTKQNIKKLDSLCGKKLIIGIRDCRNLLVAGKI